MAVVISQRGAMPQKVSAMPIPFAYIRAANSALATAIRKEDRSKYLKKQSSSFVVLQQRQALRREAAAFNAAILEGASVWQFAESLGWMVPPVLIGTLNQAACDWIDARWEGK